MNKMLVNIACFISALGAINWGLKAFWNFDLVRWVSMFFGGMPYLEKVLYAVVAISGVIALLSLFLYRCCEG